MNELEDEGFPDEDVRASMADRQLQQEHRLEDLDDASRSEMEAMKSRALAPGAGPCLPTGPASAGPDRASSPLLPTLPTSASFGEIIENAATS